MRYIYLYVLLLVLSCSNPNNEILVKNFGSTQGTFYHIKYFSPNGINYQQAIDSILLKIDNSLSIYNDSSVISRINEYHDVVLDTLFLEVFKIAKQVYETTEGNFDCSIYPLIDAWGFYQNNLSDTKNIDSVFFKSILSNVGFDKIKLNSNKLILQKPMKLDFNSLAQGYTVDLISSFLAQKNITNYLVEVGGEIRAGGKNYNKKWRIGIDKPNDSIDYSKRFQIIIELENKSLATSGNYRKFFLKDNIKYSHIISPITGFPANNRLLSVTVIHDECILADAYATAFMVMGVKKTKEFVLSNKNLEVYLIYTSKNGDWKTYISPSLESKIIN